MLKRFSKDKQAVSPVIATILMVAITVVLAATLYMMMSPDEEPKGKEAMSGRISEVDYGWIVEIDGGSVMYEEDKVQLYDETTGAVLGNFTEDTGDGPPTQMDDDNIYFIFRDNNDNGDIDGGDTIVIGDEDDYLEDRFQIRIQDTSLELEF